MSVQVYEYCSDHTSTQTLNTPHPFFGGNTSRNCSVRCSYSQIFRALHSREIELLVCIQTDVACLVHQGEVCHWQCGANFLWGQFSWRQNFMHVCWPDLSSSTAVFRSRSWWVRVRPQILVMQASRGSGDSHETWSDVEMASRYRFNLCTVVRIHHLNKVTCVLTVLDALLAMLAAAGSWVSRRSEFRQRWMAPSCLPSSPYRKIMCMPSK